MTRIEFGVHLFLFLIYFVKRVKFVKQGAYIDVDVNGLSIVSTK